jgi:guanosine-3',5'-bis(diphosphate) 3'-pyrophosphohydrolase
VFEAVLKKLHADTVDDLYASVGEGLHTEREVMTALYPSHRPGSPRSDKIVPLGPRRAKSGKGAAKEHAVPITGLIPGMAMHFAGCCHPLPGDRIVGIVTTGKGVTIHTIDCETLESFADAPERWLDVAWSQGREGADGGHMHVGRLHVVLANEPGNLGSMSTIIGKSNGNISNLKITSRSVDFFELMVDVEVTDLRHLTNIIAALRATPVVNSVERARG